MEGILTFGNEIGTWIKILKKKRPMQQFHFSVITEGHCEHIIERNGRNNGS